MKPFFNTNISKIICALLMLSSLCLALLSYFLLPDMVITQFSVSSSDVTTMPKIPAVIIPTVLTSGGALVMLLAKDNRNSAIKGLVVSLVGLAVFALMLIVNL